MTTEDRRERSGCPLASVQWEEEGEEQEESYPPLSSHSLEGLPPSHPCPAVTFQKLLG